MRIAISAQDDRGLEGVVAHHFGRCPYFAFVDVEGHTITEVEVLGNPYYNKHQPGQVPKYIQRQGADVMVAGGMGQRAIQIFDQMGIEAYSGAAGTIRRAVELVVGGQLTEATPCRDHSGGEPHAHVEGEGGGEERGEVGRLREEVAALRDRVEAASDRLDAVSQSES